MTLAGLCSVSCATVPETERLESAGASPITDTKSGVLSSRPRKLKNLLPFSLPSTLEQTKVFSFYCKATDSARWRCSRIILSKRL